MIFDWIIVWFHVLYFLLALCVGVRLPRRVYWLFGLILVLAVSHSVTALA
jgi:hypothetical protein